MDSKQLARAELSYLLEHICAHHHHHHQHIRAMNHPECWKPHLVKAGVNKAYIKNLMFQVIYDKNMMKCRIDLAQKNLKMIKETRDEFGALIFDHADLLSDKEYKYFLDSVMNNYKFCKETYEGLKDLHEKGLEWNASLHRGEAGVDEAMAQCPSGWTATHKSIEHLTSKPK